MKKFISVLFLLIMAFSAMGQDEAIKEKEIVKRKKYSFFDLQFEVLKYDDGTKAWEFIDQPKEYEPKPPRKPSKGSGDLTLDLGINNWRQQVSDAPQVKPWGSWNVGINYRYNYKASKNFHINPAIGVNWYNFKFEDRNLQATKTNDGLVFTDFPEGTGTKSKISASFATISIVPTLQSNNGKFRIGVGPYAGVRIGGRGKFVYNDDKGNSSKIFERSNMYVNDFRYGGRLEIGVADVDIFAAYDFNELFQTNKGPKVNAFSFGLIF